MDTTRFVFFSALFASLLLAAPAFTDPPSPTPSATPSGWNGVGWLKMTDPPYDLKKHEAACDYTVLADKDTANWDCYAWDEKTKKVDWSHEVGSGAVVGDFSKGGPIAADGSVAEYMWAVWRDNSIKISAHEYDLIQALPYSDPTQGQGIGYGPSGEVCNSSDTSAAIQTSVADDFGTNGVGWHTYPSCPKQNWNHGSCQKVATTFSWACYCSNAWGTFTQYDYPEGTTHYLSPTPCHALSRELFYWGGAVSKQ